MLEGLDKDWYTAGNRRFASYSNIPGGKYRFRLKARLTEGPWIESGDPIAVFVSSPFYFTWWFYLLCAVVISLIIYTIFKYRLTHILKMERMRTSISSDLHDEVGASLTSISLFSEMVRQPGATTEKKEEYLQRIGERSRDSIEKMSDIIWSINPDNDNLNQMLVRMKNYATEVAEAVDITVHWTESGDLSGARLSMEDRKNVYLFFKEAVNNAIKHSGAQNIYLHLATTAHLITISIMDDGKGFDSAAITSGNGLKNLQRRAALLHGTNTIESCKNKGTAVTLHFTPSNN
jgi:signal transduction histidine kinase